MPIIWFSRSQVADAAETLKKKAIHLIVSFLAGKIQIIFYDLSHSALFIGFLMVMMILILEPDLQGCVILVLNELLS